MDNSSGKKHPAVKILISRHAFYNSWFLVADELGYNKGVLCAVANEKRRPSKKLIERMNEVYGCHLHLETVKRNVPVCPVCDQPYEPRHRCPSAPRKPRRTYDISYKQLRELLQSPYLMS